MDSVDAALCGAPNLRQRSIYAVQAVRGERRVAINRDLRFNGTLCEHPLEIVRVSRRIDVDREIIERAEFCLFAVKLSTHAS